MINLMENVTNEMSKQQEQASVWSGSRFAKLDTLKNDYAGKAGERYLFNLCRELDISVSYEEDRISTDGTYDIKMNGREVEVKTARLGSSKSPNFQHEGLRDGEKCDNYIFVDVAPEEFFLTILNKKDTNLRSQHPILKVTPHLRRKTENTYKFDTSYRSLARGIEGGITLRVTSDTKKQDVRDFILRHLS